MKKMPPRVNCKSYGRKKYLSMSTHIELIEYNWHNVSI